MLCELFIIHCTDISLLVGRLDQCVVYIYSIKHNEKHTCIKWCILLLISIFVYGIGVTFMLY